VSPFSLVKVYGCSEEHLPPSSVLKNAYTLFSSCFVLGVLFDLEGGGNAFNYQAMQYHIAEDYIESYSSNRFWNTSATWLFVAKCP
jgi:hypothetical protein